MSDEVIYRVNAGQDGHLTRLETPALERHDTLIMGFKRQVVAQEEIEHGVQATAGDFGTILEFKGACSGIAGIGEQRFLVELAFLVEFLETFPGQQNLASHLKFVRQVIGAHNLQRHRLDSNDIGCHIITLHAITSRDGTHQPTMLIGDRNRSAVIFHLAHNLARLASKAILGTAQEILHLLDAIAIGQRHHGALMPYLSKSLGDVTTHTLGGR